jgi:uncharacterized protein (DUF2126 family)
MEGWKNERKEESYVSPSGYFRTLEMRGKMEGWKAGSEWKRRENIFSVDRKESAGKRMRNVM